MPIWNQSREPVSKTQQELEKYLKEEHPDKENIEAGEKENVDNKDLSAEEEKISEDKTYYYLSIVSLVLTVLMWPFGLILGGFCLAKMKQGSKGRRFALVAVILGSVYLVFIALIITIASFFI